MNISVRAQAVSKVAHFVDEYQSSKLLVSTSGGGGAEPEHWPQA